MCTAVLHFNPSAARSSASMPQKVLTSSMYTSNAGSSNWMDVGTPSALEIARFLVQVSVANAIARRERSLERTHRARVSTIVIGPGGS